VLDGIPVLRSQLKADTFTGNLYFLSGPEHRSPVGHFRFIIKQSIS
jgi:hypothetical protein